MGAFRFAARILGMDTRQAEKHSDEMQPSVFCQKYIHDE